MRLTLTLADLRERADDQLVDLVTKTGLVPSKSEARRLIIQGGIEIDEQKQSDANKLIAIVDRQSIDSRSAGESLRLVEVQGSSPDKRGLP